MDTPFFKSELVRVGPFDFWRTKLYDLRDAVYHRMEEDGKCPICLQSDKPHENCGFDDVESDIIKTDSRTAPMSFWKEKLDQLRKAMDEAAAEDAICPVCLGSWSCKAGCERARAEREIKEHQQNQE